MARQKIRKAPSAFVVRAHNGFYAQLEEGTESLGWVVDASCATRFDSELKARRLLEKRLGWLGAASAFEVVPADGG